MTLNWQWKSFEELSKAELYAILKLRQEVFIVEQECWYLDADDSDQYSHHLLGTDSEGNIQAYARILPPDKKFPGEASFGRIVTTMPYRRKGYGRKAMDLLLEEIVNQYGPQAIRIEAQTYLIPFYEEYGFTTVGEAFEMDGLPHIVMTRPRP